MTAMRRCPTGTDSIRMPPSLRGGCVPSMSIRSLGHFKPMNAPPRGPAGSSASASATPIASDSPDQSGGVNGKASEQVSEAPALDCQLRPQRPRPRVCCSATSRQGWVSPARRPRRVLSSSGIGPLIGGSSSPGREGTTSDRPPERRARSTSTVLLDSQRATTSIDRPGSNADSSLHSGSVFHDRVTGSCMAQSATGGCRQAACRSAPSMHAHPSGRASVGAALQCLGASIVPRQSSAPQRQANCFLSFLV